MCVQVWDLLCLQVVCKEVWSCCVCSCVCRGVGPPVFAVGVSRGVVLLCLQLVCIEV